MKLLRSPIVVLALVSIAPTIACAGDARCARDPRCEFRFPTSGVERLRPEWLTGLPQDTLWEARNEIMARHGYIFDTQRARQIFYPKPYYVPRTKTVRLSAIEKYNVDLIRSFEDGRGGAYQAARADTAASDVGTDYEVTGLERTSDGFLAVRTGPGAAYPEIARLHQADRVTVVASSGTWFKVRFAGGEGWSHSRYLVGANAAAMPPAVVPPPQEEVADDARADRLRSDLATISDQLADLSTQVADRQEAQQTQPSAASGEASEIDALRRRIADLEKRKTETSNELRSYATPVRPDNANLQTDARRSSEEFQKVPYFVPGTKTVGEMWVEPKVDDTGHLGYAMNFVDPEAAYQKVAVSIPLTPDEVKKTETALASVAQWSATATEKKIRKRYEKEALCLPEARCGGDRKDGLVTTVVFQIDDDGSTATLLRTRQGAYERSFGFSMASTDVLRRYLDHVVEEGSADFQAGTATKSDLDDLFK